MDVKEKIAQAMARVRGEMIHMPTDHEEYTPLKGKKVLVIDDDRSIIAEVIPSMMVATDGNFEFLLDSGDLERHEFCELVLEKAKSADIVLVDYELANGLVGTTIVELLREQLFEGEIVGFSSVGNYNKKLMESGADSCISKGYDMPESYLPLQLARTLGHRV